MDVLDVLDGRSVVSLSDAELLPVFDLVDAGINGLEEIRLQLIARIEDTGYAQELGARDAVELVSKRYRRDRAEAWRDVRLARALPKYTAVSDALTHGIEHPTDTTDATDGTATTDDPNGTVTTDDPNGTVTTDHLNDTASSDSTIPSDGTVPSDGVVPCDGAGALVLGDAGGAGAVVLGDAGGAGAAELGDAGDGAVDGRRVDGVRPLRTAQAAVIVSELERVRSRVPVEYLDVAEEQFVALALHLSPAELRSAARQVCDLLDCDGPEPEEHKAAARESLTLTAADRGVKFKGFLANENAELFRAIVHAGARPHKTVDGEPDPRSRDKRQADALSTALTIAATAWDTNTATPNQPAPTPAYDTADDAAADRTPADAAPDPAADPPTGHAAADAVAGPPTADAAADAVARPPTAQAGHDPVAGPASTDGAAVRPTAGATDDAGAGAPTGHALAGPQADPLADYAGGGPPADDATAAPTAAGSMDQPVGAAVDRAADGAVDAAVDGAAVDGAALDGAALDGAVDQTTVDGVVDGAVGGVAGGVAVRGSGCGDRVPGYGAKATISVTIDLQDLTAATADAVGQTVYSDGLSAAAIRRLACDANII
ncbi:MAG: DUF222 domain-containing protein, partial [Kribbellaceae bacterium]|nr:DUF222 domain-containing protein [Kribbellaceae bacterium]